MAGTGVNLSLYPLSSEESRGQRDNGVKQQGGRVRWEQHFLGFWGLTAPSLPPSPPLQEPQIPAPAQRALLPLQVSQMTGGALRPRALVEALRSAHQFEGFVTVLIDEPHADVP